MAETLRERLERRYTSLKSARQWVESDWREIAKFAMPSRSRFLNSEANRKRTFRLLDDYGVGSFRTLQGGMTSGLSSPSRPWFALETSDDMMADYEVRGFLSDAEETMYRFLAGTNFYSSAKEGYGELGAFGTEACVMEWNDRAGTAIFHQLTAGEYWLGVSNALVADTLYRRVPMTVKQVVDRWGNAASPWVRGQYDRSSYDAIVPVMHAVEPRADRNPLRIDGRNKPWASIYWDENADKRSDTLSEGGFDVKPFYAPRWSVIGHDAWGYSPGMDALPSLRELQLQAKRRNEAIDQLIKPEKVVDANVKLTGNPGNIVSVASINEQMVQVPYQMPYQAIQATADQVERCRQQIDMMSYADLFMAITNMQGIQPRTVEEIASRNEEKLTQLGPVIERVNTEKLEVVIDWTFAQLSAKGMFPDPPEAIQGVDLRVNFVSILTQMQRMVGIGQIERTAGFIGNLAGVFPEAVDKLDVDEMIDEYASRAGAPAKMIRTADMVASIRNQRAQQQAAQQAAENMPAMREGAEAARLLSETDASGGSLLDSLMPA